MRQLLEESDKDTITSYVYPSNESLLESKYQLLNIFKSFFDIIDSLDYTLKCLSFEIIILIYSRGELSDLTLLGFNVNHPDVEPTLVNLQFCLDKRECLISTLQFVIQKVLYFFIYLQVSQIGISTKLLKFCCKIIALSIYRLPFWGKYVYNAIKSYKKTIKPWLQLEIAKFVDLLRILILLIGSANSIAEDSENDPLISTLNYELVDEKLTRKFPSEIARQNALLPEKNACIEQIAKYGRLYFTVYNEWLNVTLNMLNNMYRKIQVYNNNIIISGVVFVDIKHF